MKVLFVGEGPHDIGVSGKSPNQPRMATSVVSVLARKAAPTIDPATAAIRWADIVLLGKRSKKRGLQAKVSAAIVLSFSKGFHGIALIHDRDKDEARLALMEAGKVDGDQQVDPGHKSVCAVAVESIEAWILGAPSALASELGKSIKDVTDHYKPHRVEELYENSAKVERRPKVLLAKIAELAHRQADTPFRIAVAEKTDIDELKQHCPEGFKPFAEALAKSFASG